MGKRVYEDIDLTFSSMSSVVKLLWASAWNSMDNTARRKYNLSATNGMISNAFKTEIEAKTDNNDDNITI